jgi:cyclophilin family peptidyl-prolyl cis-trans isomerase
VTFHLHHIHHEDEPQNPVTSITSIMNALLRLSTKLLSQPPRLLTPILSTTNESIRSMATGPRGARGHGWLVKYRSGRGGRHLQGRWHYRDVDELNSLNDRVFAMNEKLDKKETEAYLDLSVGGEEPRRVVIELAAAVLPKTTSNFRKLCQEGEEGGYKSTSVYKIEKTVGLCLGDVIYNNGSSGRCHPDLASPLTPFSFEDEGFYLSHTDKGIVSMMSPGVHSNDSRFLITTEGAPQLDGRFVAFGRVKEGMDVIEHVASSVFTKRGRPTVEITVADCGTA